jgi:hypothetical protein
MAGGLRLAVGCTGAQVFLSLITDAWKNSFGCMLFVGHLMQSCLIFGVSLDAFMAQCCTAGLRQRKVRHCRSDDIPVAKQCAKDWLTMVLAYQLGSSVCRHGSTTKTGDRNPCRTPSDGFFSEAATIALWPCHDTRPFNTFHRLKNVFLSHDVALQTSRSLQPWALRRALAVCGGMLCRFSRKNNRGLASSSTHAMGLLVVPPKQWFGRFPSKNDDFSRFHPKKKSGNGLIVIGRLVHF